jgi:hypothetical protein
MPRFPRLHVAAFAVLALSLGSLAARALADDPPASPAQPVDLRNTTCPVMGRPVQPGITETVDGAIVHFCCRQCPPKYRANPAAYQAALRADPEVAKRLDAIAARADRDEPPASPPPSKPGTPPMTPPAASPDAPPEPPPVTEPTSLVQTDKAGQLHDAMRKLWTDHVWWTRQVIVATFAGTPDADGAAKRLLRNQMDIGNAIKPFYGEDAGAKLHGLLKAHIEVAREVLTSMKSKNEAQMQEATQKWSRNADDIAAFLAGANPKAWPLEDAKKMLRDHLDATSKEAKARLAGDWDADVSAFDEVHDQALKMADMLSDGIRRQHPDKLR